MNVDRLVWIAHYLTMIGAGIFLGKAIESGNYISYGMAAYMGIVHLVLLWRFPIKEVVICYEDNEIDEYADLDREWKQRNG